MSACHAFTLTSFEVYLNDCNSAPPADLRTELRVPLAPVS
jgi:hypothetical protein